MTAVTGFPGLAALAGLVRYQSALLLRSQRWIGPLLLYAAFLAAGIRPGEPVLDSLGWAAAGLVPVAAWLVRVCVTNEPAAARDCAAAAAGPVRVHAAALLTALGGALLAGAVAAAVVLLVGGRAGVPAGTAAGAAALAVPACALAGTAVGALGSRPLVRPTGFAVLAGGLGSLAALGLSGSPARGAVTALVAGSRTGTVATAGLAAATAAALALAWGAGAVACLVARRRG
ncbi:ABC transporter [Streptomyces sp. NPDC090445]|uniref:ABC transporter n=1 Tax=Streptomyces sp. NPDC090445 TaxID=3365963 RepID=UPI003818E577